MRVAFHTLGCKVNHYETEALREAFVSHGAVSVPEDDPADVYIINTCTVTNIADRKSRQYIRRMKKVNPDALIVVITEAIENGDTDLIITIDPDSGYYEGTQDIREIFIKHGESYPLTPPIKQGCDFIGWGYSCQRCRYQAGIE